MKIVLLGNRTSGLVTLLNNTLPEAGFTLLSPDVIVYDFAAADAGDAIAESGAFDIVVCTAGFSRPDRQKVLSREAFLVVSSDNGPALAFAKEMGLPTVTCGFSSKDTITVSGISDESAAICLQRGILIGPDRTLEPHEAVIPLSQKRDAFDLMAMYVILLLCGQNGEAETAF